MKWFLGLLFFVFVAFNASASERIISGVDVDPEEYPAVGKVRFNNNECSAVVVGPHAALTAAHCVVDLQKGTLTLPEGKYPVKAYRSPLYPNEYHDVAILVIRKEVSAEPFSIGRKPKKGLAVEMLGYGCSESSGMGAGTLRLGKAKLTGIRPLEVVTDGSALCFGDSGAPLVDSRDEVIGVGSRGNITDTSWFTRLDSEQTQDFLKSVSDDLDLEICGFNSDC